MVVVDFRLALWEPKAVSARKAWYDVCHKLQVLEVFSRNCGAPQSSVLGAYCGPQGLDVLQVPAAACLQVGAVPSNSQPSTALCWGATAQVVWTVQLYAGEFLQET